MLGEAGAGCCFLQQTIELDVLDLVASSALFAEKQRPVMRMPEMLARRIGVAALDLVEESIFEKEVERAIDGRRRDRLAFLPRELVDDRIGAEGGGAFSQDRENSRSTSGKRKAAFRRSAKPAAA